MIIRVHAAAAENGSIIRCGQAIEIILLIIIKLGLFALHLPNLSGDIPIFIGRGVVRRVKVIVNQRKIKQTPDTSVRKRVTPPFKNFRKTILLNLIEATNKVLATYGLVATEQAIRRAYWRHCKRRGGFNIGLDHQSYVLAEYLQLNRLTQSLDQQQEDDESTIY